MQYDVNIFFLCKYFGLFRHSQWRNEIVLMFKLEAMFGYPLFNLLPVRLPPLFIDITSPDANVFSVK